MTRMLYTEDMSDSLLRSADEKQSCRTAAKRELLRSLELNAWLAISTATYLATLFLIRNHPTWSAGWKIMLALGPLLPGLLYLRNGMRLLRELDELQRRIRLEAWLFAAVGTVIVSTVINVFNAQGLTGIWPIHGLEVGGTYLTMSVLWSVGIMLASLRYR